MPVPPPQGHRIATRLTCFGCRRPCPPRGLTHAPELSRTSSPLLPHLRVWRTGLNDHPNREFAHYIVEGLQDGFRMGFDYTSSCRPAKCNMPSATDHPEVIDQYVVGECNAGRILGPFRRGAVDGLQVNRLGVVPKGHVPGKWRLITDLSFPEGASVNDGIDRRLCSLRCTSVDSVARVAQAMG